MNQRKKFSRILLLFSALFLGNMTFAQESMRAEEIGNDWTSYAIVDGLKVSLKKELCDVGAPDKFTYGMVRLENTTNEDITLEYYFELEYENGCVACGEVREYVQLVTVPAGTTLEGDASFERPELTFLMNNPYQKELGALLTLKAGQLNIK
jgi:hypothetical protein